MNKSGHSFINEKMRKSNAEPVISLNEESRQDKSLMHDKTNELLEKKIM